MVTDEEEDDDDDGYDDDSDALHILRMWLEPFSITVAEDESVPYEEAPSDNSTPKKTTTKKQTGCFLSSLK